MKALGHIRSHAILKRQAGGKKIASVDRQHTITVVLAPISEGTFAPRPLAGEDAVHISRIVDFLQFGSIWS